MIFALFNAGFSCLSADREISLGGGNKARERQEERKTFFSHHEGGRSQMHHSDKQRALLGVPPWTMRLPKNRMLIRKDDEKGYSKSAIFKEKKRKGKLKSDMLSSLAGRLASFRQDLSFNMNEYSSDPDSHCSPTVLHVNHLQTSVTKACCWLCQS